MSLDNIIQATARPTGANFKDDDEITEERVDEHIDQLRQLIGYWRLYPDRFIDYLCEQNPKNTFKLYFYQRLFLRATARHKFVFATFVRAWSKSFMSVLTLVIRAILYPGSKIFVVAGGERS